MHIHIMHWYTIPASFVISAKGNYDFHALFVWLFLTAFQNFGVSIRSLPSFEFNTSNISTIIQYQWWKCSEEYIEVGALQWLFTWFFVSRSFVSQNFLSLFFFSFSYLPTYLLIIFFSHSSFHCSLFIIHSLVCVSSIIFPLLY